MFADNYGTSFISIPKYDCDKDLPPLPGKHTQSKYIYFDLNILRELFEFSLDNAFFSVGAHTIKQILGLAMGDPCSPPLAILFVALDEYGSRLPPLLSQHCSVLLLIKRYVDDVKCFIATRDKHNERIACLTHHIVHNTYEQNVPKYQRRLQLVQTFEPKFLDADVIVSPSNSSIKLIYHNKMHPYLYLTTKPSVASSTTMIILTYCTKSTPYLPYSFAFMTSHLIPKT